MQDRHKIHIALPRRPAIRSALENALRAASNLHLGNYDLTDNIDDAEVVVTDSETQENEIGKLPASVRYLQLIDCGSGAPNMTDDGLTVANASSLLVHDPADWAIDQWREIARQSSRTRQKGPNVAGIIGFGSLGYELGKRLNELGAKIWVNDIRTPQANVISRASERADPRSTCSYRPAGSFSSPSITDPLPTHCYPAVSCTFSKSAPPS